MVSFNQSFKQGLTTSASFDHPVPIIIGLPRSGTTLLRLMLDAHSELAVTHEAGFIPMASNLTNPLSRMFYKRLMNTAKYGSWANGLLEEFYRIVTEINNWNHYIEIRYEDLVLKTTDILQKICRFINLPYELGMERYYRQARQRMDELGYIYNRDGRVSVTKESRLARHRLTTRAPEPGRIGHWKTAMTKADLSTFNKVAGHLLQELGYEK